jgi:Fur family ferric uptake transcriptional regulator
MTESIIESLRSQGFRITKVRRGVIEMLTNASQPLSALEILQSIKNTLPNVNKTTIYRELDFLTSHEIVSEIDILEGMKRYELVTSSHHHHHLVCTDCNSIQCVEMENDLDELERRIRARHQFTVRSHILEFFGCCSRCEEKRT